MPFCHAADRQERFFKEESCKGQTSKEHQKNIKKIGGMLLKI